MKYTIPQPRAFGGGPLDEGIDLKKCTPEAMAEQFIKSKTAALLMPFLDATGVDVFFKIRHDKDGTWFASSDEHRIYSHGDTMRELWHNIHAIMQSFASPKPV